MSLYKLHQASDAAGESAEKTSEPGPKNKQHVMILSTRGITARHRHLMQDPLALLPHSKKGLHPLLRQRADPMQRLTNCACLLVAAIDSKLDSKSDLQLLNEN